MKETVRNISASQFKAKCLSLLDEIDKTGLPVIVTKRGQPVAKVIPVKKTQDSNLLGSVSYKSKDDLLSPIDEKWDADL
jgi:prevent-host-death family protein